MDLRLVVLARWPAPGRCKRRLAVTCGPAAAAAVQGALTAHTLAVARQAAQHCGARLELVIDGLGSRARRRWARQLAVVHSSAQGVAASAAACSGSCGAPSPMAPSGWC